MPHWRGRWLPSIAILRGVFAGKPDSSSLQSGAPPIIFVPASSALRAISRRERSVESKIDWSYQSLPLQLKDNSSHRLPSARHPLIIGRRLIYDFLALTITNTIPPANTNPPNRGESGMVF